MCDFHYPYYSVGPLCGSRVQYIGNVDDVEVSKIGCYNVGHSGSFTFYYDGVKTYGSSEQLPYGMYWKNECPPRSPWDPT